MNAEASSLQRRCTIHCIWGAVLLGLGLSAGGVGGAGAAEPGWSPVVIASGPYRERIRSLPIEQRPYRPLHVYGNTVRRIHYRGTPFRLFADPSVLPQQARSLPRRSGSDR